MRAVARKGAYLTVLALALAGSAYAGGKVGSNQIAANAITSKAIAANAVTSAKIKEVRKAQLRSIGAKDIKDVASLGARVITIKPTFAGASKTLVRSRRGRLTIRGYCYSRPNGKRKGGVEGPAYQALVELSQSSDAAWSGRVTGDTGDLSYYGAAASTRSFGEPPAPIGGASFFGGWFSAMTTAGGDAMAGRFEVATDAGADNPVCRFYVAQLG